MIDRVPVDFVVKPGELSSLIERLVATPAGPEGHPDRVIDQLEGNQAGTPAEAVCPTCQGVLTVVAPGALRHYRCHVEHAFTLESLVREQSEEMERALWAAVRALEESASLSRHLASSNTGEVQRRFAEKA